MDADVIAPAEFLAAAPKAILRPCDYSLQIAMRDLETQLGTIEAFNRMVAGAAFFRGQIEAKKIKEPVPGTANPAK